MSQLRQTSSRSSHAGPHHWADRRFTQPLRVTFSSHSCIDNHSTPTDATASYSRHRLHPHTQRFSTSDYATFRVTSLPQLISSYRYSCAKDIQRSTQATGYTPSACPSITSTPLQPPSWTQRPSTPGLNFRRHSALRSSQPPLLPSSTGQTFSRHFHILPLNSKSKRHWEKNTNILQRKGEIVISKLSFV